MEKFETGDDALRVMQEAQVGEGASLEAVLEMPPPTPVSEIAGAAYRVGEEPLTDEEVASRITTIEENLKIAKGRPETPVSEIAKGAYGL